MNHDEIWDDSALIESWNDALAEYKKYHSVHAKGGSVEDLPPSRNKTQADAKNETQDEDQPMDESEAEPTDETAADAGQTRGAQRNGEKGLDTGGAAAQAGLLAGSSGMPGPQMILGSVQDEGLKRLLMSWYYAGYYTGVYEGQQQAKQPGQGQEQTRGSDDA